MPASSNLAGGSSISSGPSEKPTEALGGRSGCGNTQFAWEHQAVVDHVFFGTDGVEIRQVSASCCILPSALLLSRRPRMLCHAGTHGHGLPAVPAGVLGDGQRVSLRHGRFVALCMLCCAVLLSCCPALLLCCAMLCCCGSRLKQEFALSTIETVTERLVGCAHRDNNLPVRALILQLPWRASKRHADRDRSEGVQYISPLAVLGAREFQQGSNGILGARMGNTLRRTFNLVRQQALLPVGGTSQREATETNLLMNLNSISSP